MLIMSDVEWTLLCTRPIGWAWFFNVKVHESNCLQEDMPLYPYTLFWLWADQSMLLLLNAACLAAKQQTSILMSLVWTRKGSNPRPSTQEACKLTITSLWQFKNRMKLYHFLCLMVKILLKLIKCLCNICRKMWFSTSLYWWLYWPDRIISQYSTLKKIWHKFVSICSCTKGMICKTWMGSMLLLLHKAMRRNCAENLSYL